MAKWKEGILECLEKPDRIRSPKLSGEALSELNKNNYSILLDGFKY
jgi:hypothetical protein